MLLRRLATFARTFCQGRDHPDQGVKGTHHQVKLSLQVPSVPHDLCQSRFFTDLVGKWRT